MDAAAARARVAAAPVARLATIGADGVPDLVPVTFALCGEDRLVTAVDHKPKRTQRLRRLDNVAADPRVTLLVDHYAQDWSKLWWVRVRGLAEVVVDEPRRTRVVAPLAGKYPAYRERPPTGPALVVEITQWRWWEAAAG